MEGEKEKKRVQNLFDTKIKTFNLIFKDNILIIVLLNIYKFFLLMI